MANLSLTDREIELLKKSINHCLETCDEGGGEKGCPDCKSLKDVLEKISRA